MRRYKIILIMVAILITLTISSQSEAMGTMQEQQGAFKFEDYKTKEAIEKEILKRYPIGSDDAELKKFLIEHKAHYIGEKEIDKNEEIKKINVLFSEESRENDTNYINALKSIQKRDDGLYMFFRYSKSSSFGSISSGWMIKVFLSQDRKIKDIEVSKELTGL